MIPREFEYHAPKSLPDALGLLDDSAMRRSCSPAATACCR